MREITEFIKARIFQIGFKSQEDFLDAAIDLERATFYNVMRRRNVKTAYERTRQSLARNLKFREWADLLKAFEADDVTWGLLSTADMPYRMPPVPKEPPKMPISKAENELMIAANKLALASLEQKRQLIRELPKETVAAIEEIFSDNKQPPAKRSRRAAKHKQKS